MRFMDICLLSHKFDDMQSKVEDVKTEAAFKINTSKTKAKRELTQQMCENSHCSSRILKNV